MKEIEKKVEQFIKDYNITGEVLIGFSGGVDSMCLLDVTTKLASKYNIHPTALHLNHNWRGEQSLQDEINCKKFCASKGIDFYAETLPENIPHTETAAREARYEFFERCAKKFGSKIIFTAHNASDNAETVLYRIFKGTGINGLTGIKKAREIYYRPLIEIYRDEIENYCKENHLTPNIDESNFNTEYNRNFIRHEIIKSAEKINPDVLQALNTLSENASETSQIADEYTEIVKSELKTENGLDTGKFISLSKALQNRIIYGIFQDNALDTDSEKINRIREFINSSAALKSGTTCSLNGELRLFVNNRIISLQKNCDGVKFEILIRQTGRYKTPFGEFILEECSQTPSELKKDDESYVYATLNEINFTLRTRRDGDIIQPLGMAGHQKLKKYFNEKKLPYFEKDRIVLLVDGKEILWAAGYGLSEKIKAGEKPTHMLKFIKEEVGNGN